MLCGQHSAAESERGERGRAVGGELEQDGYFQTAGLCMTPADGPNKMAPALLARSSKPPQIPSAVASDRAVAEQQPVRVLHTDGRWRRARFSASERCCGGRPANQRSARTPGRACLGSRYLDTIHRKTLRTAPKRKRTAGAHGRGVDSSQLLAPKGAGSSRGYEKNGWRGTGRHGRRVSAGGPPRVQRMLAVMSWFSGGPRWAVRCSNLRVLPRARPRREEFPGGLETKAGTAGPDGAVWALAPCRRKRLCPGTTCTRAWEACGR